MKTIVSDGRSVDRYIPPSLRGMFYRNPSRRYMRSNGVDPYSFSTNGLVLYLPLWALKGGSFKSVDAYGHTCAVTGASWRPNGRDFDGSAHLISIPDHASLDLTTEATIELWVNIDTSTGDKACMLVARNTNGYAFYVYSSDYHTGASQDRYAFGKNGVDELLGDTALTAGSWAHLIGVKSGGDNSVYLNSVLDCTPAAKADFVALADAILIGDGYGASQHFDGTIGEIRIYNRALTLSEIQHNRLATMWRYQ